MKTTPDNQKLLDLVNGARTGRIVLPQFQRNFIWNRDDITDLLVSILEGYFIGSFLLLRVNSDHVPFAMRPLQGVRLRRDDLRPEWMILDGQQRLTSLHYVFAAPNLPLRYTKYPYHFFLNLQKLSQGETEDAIWSERSDRVGEYLEPTKQFESLQVPFTELERWNDWLNAYERWLIERDKDAYFDKYFPSDKPTWNTAIDRIRSFFVPTIEIPAIKADDDARVAEVCAIFEKMNSKGVRLSVYDLLTARMYQYGIDMHKLWKESVNCFYQLNQFSDGKPDSYGIYLLRTIALLRGKDVKSRTLINLEPEQFERDWWRAAEHMEQGLQRITSIGPDGYGAFDPKWTPYSTMISPMAALLTRIDEQNLDHYTYKLLHKWYWASIFRERYAGSVESTIYRDYQDLLATFEDPSATPTAFADVDAAIVENAKYSLLDVSRRNSIYRGVMCLVALQGAKDFQADDSIEFHTLDDHHVFPKAYLRQAKRPDGSSYPNDLTNCIVNRTLIASNTNRRISRNAPSNYLERVVPAERMKEIMTSHFISEGALGAMKEDDFETFLLYRENALVDEIRRRLTL